MKKFQIRSQHTIFTNSYADGEGAFVQEYVTKEIIEANDWQQAIHQFYNEILGFDFYLKNASIEDNKIFYSNLVDEHNNQAFENQNSN